MEPLVYHLIITHQSDENMRSLKIILLKIITSQCVKYGIECFRIFLLELSTSLWNHAYYSSGF